MPTEKPSNYLIYWYDSDADHIAMVHGATQQQIEHFIDSGGNADLPMEMINLCVCLGNAPLVELGAFILEDALWVNDLSIRNESIAHFTVDYSQYEDGKIIPMPKDPTTILPDDPILSRDDIGETLEDPSHGDDDEEFDDLEFEDADKEDEDDENQD